MNFKRFIFICSCLGAIVFQVQQLKGQVRSNDWINPGQEYFKINVAEKGVYQISYQALAAEANVDVSTVDPAGFQLFLYGEEQPIEVLTGNDGQFNSGDVIRFYGEKNDGTLDSGLYLNPEDQPHDYYSLYTDTASYFLTWNENQQGKRFNTFEDTNYSQYTPEDYFMKHSLSLATQNYYDGAPLLDIYSPFLLGLSYYTKGEGYGGGRFASFNIYDITVNTSNYYEQGPSPQGEILMYGDSRWDSAGYTSGVQYHHKTKIWINNELDPNYLIEEHLHAGFEKELLTYTFEDNDIRGSNTSFHFRAYGNLDRGLTLDYSKVSYAKVIYPKHFDLQGNLPFNFTLDKSKPNYHLAFPNYPSGKTRPILYDLTSESRIKGKLVNDSLKVVIPGSNERQRFFLTDSSNFKMVAPKKVTLEQFELNLSSNLDYLIVSNSSLKQAANQYASYRNSSGYNVETVYVDALYNHYSYGIHHPLGIRYFLKHLAEENNLPEHLLLLGKGLQNNKVRQGSLIQEDLVPTIGFPPSDKLYALNLKKNSEWSIDINVGRIPARTNQDALDYLNKLKNYENELSVAESQGGQLWRKNLLHIAGGKTQEENAQFVRYLNNYANTAKDTLIGAKVETISKNTSIPVDEEQEDLVIESVNEGLSLLSYFGHGAAEVLEVKIGEPKDYTQNKGNYPVYFFSGCILGNTYTESPGMAERFILNEDKGGILWVAESHYSFVNYLNPYADAFYENLGRKQYGEPMGSILRSTSNDFKNPGNYRSEMQVLQKTLQGDPAVRVFSPSKPDYSTSIEQINFKPQNPNTELDSFGIQIAINNNGKAINDSLNLKIQQRLPDFSQKTYDSIKIKAPFSIDTTIVYIQPNQNFAGENQFEIQLDPNNKIDELNKANNNVAINKFFPSSGIRPLFPREFGIVPDRSITLQAQSNNLFAEGVKYLFELDHEPTFNSAYLRSSMPLEGDATQDWPARLLPLDSFVYYWRTKQSNDTQQVSWQQSSFMYINDSRPGWAQGELNQMLSATTNDLTIDTSDRIFRFNRRTSGRYNIVSTGSKNSGSWDEIKYEGSKLFFSSATNGLYVLAIDPDRQERFYYQSPYNYQDAEARNDGHDKPKSGVFIFDWINGDGSIDSATVEDFKDHIDSIPNGFNVIAFTAASHGMADMGEDFYRTMENLGSGIIRDIKNGWPYILMGTKGSQPGEATEKTADTAIPLDPKEQILQATHTSFPLKQEATMTSSLIGPAKNWYEATVKTQTLETPSSDSVSFDVRGVTPEGNRATLFEGLSEGNHDISSVNAKQYPYLELDAYLQDTSALTPPQLDYWIVTHDRVPEGSLKPKIALNFYDDSLQQGDSIRIKFAYQNISDFTMDSLLVNFQVIDEQNQAVIDQSQRYAGLEARDTLIASRKFSTDNISGDNQFRLNVNPDFDQPEQYQFNNFYTQDFHVAVDQSNPLLDVTFNGKHIMDGAIVNPQPEIRITSKDDNRYYLMDDTSNISVVLENPEGKEKNLRYGEDLEFYPAKDASENKATVFYEPESKLKDGTYQLKVQATDKTGNQSGQNRYKKRFEVINESTITHLYPYPNPFTSRMRFIFTLTGSRIPDKVNIQIMTITGKVVKEITKQDLGPLRIGVNKTNYVWDGTDEFGDPLGNGVYFYKVKAYLNGEPIEHRETAGDKFFKKGLGKLYLMR